MTDRNVNQQENELRNEITLVISTGKKRLNEEIKLADCHDRLNADLKIHIAFNKHDTQEKPNTINQFFFYKSRMKLLIISHDKWFSD